MGFLPDDEDIYHLVFEDPKYRGLEVTMTGLSVGEMLDDMNLDYLEGVEALGDLTRVTSESLPLIKRMNEGTAKTFKAFAEHLIDWNVERKTPAGRERVPATLDGVRTQSIGFIRAIIKAWRTAVSDVPGPLDPASNGGVPSPALSLPMEISSPNPDS